MLIWIEIGLIDSRLLIRLNWKIDRINDQTEAKKVATELKPSDVFEMD